MSENKTVSSELYTTEASESRKRASVEKGVEDPTQEEAEKAIAKHEKRKGADGNE